MLVSRPQIFNGYIAVSPSLWYDNGFIFKQMLGNMKGKAFFGIGSTETTKNNNEHPMVEEMHQFLALLQSKKCPDFKITSVVFPDETHDTVFPSALTRGTVFILGKNN